jgi:hypothetical protein
VTSPFGVSLSFSLYFASVSISISKIIVQILKMFSLENCLDLISFDLNMFGFSTNF